MIAVAEQSTRLKSPDELIAVPALKGTTNKSLVGFQCHCHSLTWQIGVITSFDKHVFLGIVSMYPEFFDSRFPGT